MAKPDEQDSGRLNAEIVRFPHSRVRPSSGVIAFKELGTSKLAAQFGAPERQATGHWCSRCRGVWYGYLLEVSCPVCGNRHG